MMFQFWLILGVLLIILEVVLGFTIVLFFSGLACLTVAGLIYYHYLGVDQIINQFAAFFVATTIWALILWKPFKNLIKKISSDNHNIGIIGQHAVISEDKLVANKTGIVKWSGTLVKAQLSKESSQHHLIVGTEVKITDINNNIFIVKELTKDT